MFLERGRRCSGNRKFGTHRSSGLNSGIGRMEAGGGERKRGDWPRDRRDYIFQHAADRAALRMRRGRVRASWRLAGALGVWL